MLKHRKKIEPPLDPILRLDSDSDLRNGWYHTGLSIFLEKYTSLWRGGSMWLAHWEGQMWLSQVELLNRMAFHFFPKPCPSAAP